MQGGAGRMVTPRSPGPLFHPPAGPSRALPGPSSNYAGRGGGAPAAKKSKETPLRPPPIPEKNSDKAISLWMAMWSGSGMCVVFKDDHGGS